MTIYTIFSIPSGAQTMILTKRSPEAHFVSIDHSQESIEEAQASITNAGISNAVFYQMDLLDLKFKDKGEINL